MKKTLMLSLLALVLLLSCNKTAFTGRKQLNLIPARELNQMSFAEYKTFLAQNKTLVSSGKDVDLVRRVGNDLKAAVEVYYRSKAIRRTERFSPGNSMWWTTLTPSMPFVCRAAKWWCTRAF
jgi:hypothetical protein